MDYKSWGFSIIAVYAALFVAGLLISVLSGQLQCSKINWSTSAIQGAIFAAPASGVYAISTYFPIIRGPFVNTLISFGLPEDSAQIFGVGYLVMLTSWISTVWAIHNTEKQTCSPDLQEMSEFKKKLLAELQSKQEAEEKNNEPESNGTHITVKA